jgi:hypothetical protein
MGCRANGYRMQVARVPTPCSPDTQAVSYGITDPLRVQALGNQIFNCKDTPCSLLLLAGSIYNHVSTGRWRFYRLKVGGLAFIEEHTCHKNNECIILQRGYIAFRDLVINQLDAPKKLSGIIIKYR